MLPVGGSGANIPVKIRAINIAGGAEKQNETSTRAGGVNEKRLALEVVTPSFGDGMLARITVEEELEALRTGKTPLGDGVTFRVIAIKSSDKTYVAHGDFTVDEEASANYSDPDFLIPLQETYDFICFSFNSKDPLPEVNYTTKSALPALAVDTLKDLLWQVIPSKPIGNKEGGDAILSFTELRQQFVQVKLALDGNGMRITNIGDNNPICLKAACAGDFDLAKSEFSFDANSSIAFTFSTWDGNSAEEVISDRITFLPKAEGDYIISLAAGAVTLLDGAVEKLTAAVNAILRHSKFEAGGRYTVRMSPCKYMQDFSADACNAMAFNQITTLVDVRDGKVYPIIKLKMSADGSLARCWMQRNLELANLELTSENSNVGSNFVLSEAISSNLPTGSYLVSNPVDPLPSGAPANSGYLYNWATAIAYSSDHYGNSDTNSDLSVNALDLIPTSTTGVTDGNTQYSICPKGWRLPVGADNINEFSLVNIHAFNGSLQDWVSDLGFAAVFTGNVAYNGTIVFLNEHATFWSSSPNADSNYGEYVRAPRLLRTDIETTSDLYYNSFRYIRRSVRCIHDPD
jgi:uncharacterized protein (TIGR02145 family)